MITLRLKNGIKYNYRSQPVEFFSQTGYQGGLSEKWHLRPNTTKTISLSVLQHLFYPSGISFNTWVSFFSSSIQYKDVESTIAIIFKTLLWVSMGITWCISSFQESYATLNRVIEEKLMFYTSLLHLFLCILVFLMLRHHKWNCFLNFIFISLSFKSGRRKEL